MPTLSNLVSFEVATTCAIKMFNLDKNSSLALQIVQEKWTAGLDWRHFINQFKKQDTHMECPHWNTRSTGWSSQIWHNGIPASILEIWGWSTGDTASEAEADGTAEPTGSTAATAETAGTSSTTKVCATRSTAVSPESEALKKCRIVLEINFKNRKRNVKLNWNYSQ